MATKKTEPGKKTTKASAGGATKRGKRTDAGAAAKAARQTSRDEPDEAA